MAKVYRLFDWRSKAPATAPRSPSSSVACPWQGQERECPDYFATVSENMAFLKTHLVHSKLTAEQKGELVKFFEERHGENIDFRSEQSKERMAFLTKIANDNTQDL